MPTEFTTTHRVQFSETDLAGIAHFSNFFRWMEEVEHAFFRSLGFSISMDIDGKHIGWPRVATACDFSGPARFEDEVKLDLRIVKLGGSSMSYEVRFSVADRAIALGKMTTVCCALTREGLKPTPIPPTIREKLQA